MNTAYTRREFVRGSLGLVGMIGTVPAFLSKTALALSPDGRHRNDKQSNQDGHKKKATPQAARPAG